MNQFKIETRDLHLKPSFMRKQGSVPGAIYGKTIESTPVKATFNELKRATSASGEVYQVNFEGKKYFAKMFEIQRDPVTADYIHFSLVELPKGVANDLDIPITTTGNALGEKEGGSVIILRDMITLNGKPKDMPEEIVFDVSELNIGDNVTVADLKISKNLVPSLDDDETVIICKAPVVMEEPEEESEDETFVMNQGEETVAADSSDESSDSKEETKAEKKE